MAEDEYALTKGKIVTFIGICLILIGLLGFIFLGLPLGSSGCPSGGCNFDYFQLFVSNFYNNFIYNLFFIMLIAFGILLIFIGRHLDKN
jgi:hypothetical protein